MSPARRPTAAELMTGKAAPRVSTPRAAAKAAPETTNVGGLPPQPETPNRQHVRDLPSRPPKPVRITVDLSPDEHMALRRYATEHRANGTQVVRALLAELAEGAPDLDARVSARIRAAMTAVMVADQLRRERGR